MIRNTKTIDLKSYEVKPNFQEVEEDHQVKVASHTNNKTSAKTLQEAALNRKVDSSTSLELESTNTSPLF